MAQRPSSRQPRRQISVSVDRPQSQAGGWLRGIRFSWFSFLMLGILVFGVIIIAPNLQLYIGQQHRIADLKAANAAQSEKVSQLQKDAARWSDPSYIRAQARDRLLYVMPGETSYLIIDDRPAAAKTPDSTPVSKSIQKTKTDWMSSLFSSVMTSGLTDQSGTAGTSSTPSSIPTPFSTPTSGK